jgi:hypothetical protein
MYLREAVRLAELSNDTFMQGYALANIASSLNSEDPVAGVAAARQAVVLARRAGGRFALSMAAENLITGLLESGDWDGAAVAASVAIDEDGIGDMGMLRQAEAEFAALRGDVVAARNFYEGVESQASEDPLERSGAAYIRALVAVAEEHDDVALAKADESFTLVAEIGFGLELARWVWPIAARAAHALRDDAKLDDLLTRLDATYETRRVPLSLRAERGLALARRASRRGEESAGEQFDSVIAELRKRPSPYHLAHGLLDYAQHLIDTGEGERAAALIEEAQAIGERLQAQPLIRRAEATLATNPSMSAGHR